MAFDQQGDMGMKKKSWFCAGLLTALIMSIIACGGSLRYAERDPDMKDFHPRTIGLLSVDPGTYGEARGVVEGLISAALIEKQWFTTVLTSDTVKSQLKHDQELQNTTADYLLKLNTVNYSDPTLSKQIGDALKIDALLVVTVDSWNYSTEQKERVIQDVAKAGLSMKLIEAGTGRIAWKAGHNIVKEYTFLKPDLKDVGKSVVNAMIGDMPH
ncbi:MAG: hypothetical protein QG555_353 [Thermodesulfobacteriota bacterium]|nr:hypothetical protein [Thermodesulfobacteriota bacterium]